MTGFGSTEGFSPPPQDSPDLEHWFAQIKAEVEKGVFTDDDETVTGDWTFDGTVTFNGATSGIAFSELDGSIADGQVPQSAVTQHEAALTITESQISDLDHYTSSDFDTDFSGKSTDDLSEGVTNLYHTGERVDDQVAGLLVGGSNITLTYDDAANTLTIDGTDTDTSDHGALSGLGDDDHPQYGALAQNETVTGLWNFDTAGGANPLRVSRSGGSTQVLEVGVSDRDVRLEYIEDSGEAAPGSWSFVTTEDGTSSDEWLNVTAAAPPVVHFSQIDSVVIGSDPGGSGILRVGGNAIIGDAQPPADWDLFVTGSTTAQLAWYNAGGAVDEKTWLADVLGGDLRFISRNDNASGKNQNLRLMADGTVLVGGTDPGGSEILRVGGIGRLEGGLLVGDGKTGLVAYGGDNQGGIGLKKFIWKNLQAGSAQAVRFDVARIGVDTSNWSRGTYYLEIYGNSYRQGIKRYEIEVGYQNTGTIRCVYAGLGEDDNIRASLNPVSDPGYTELRVDLNDYYDATVVLHATGAISTTDTSPDRNTVYCDPTPAETDISSFTDSPNVYPGGPSGQANYVFGTDPGGSELLRVGGEVMANELRAKDGPSDGSFTSPGQIALKRSNDNPYFSFHDSLGARIGYLQVRSGASTILNTQVAQAMELRTNSFTRITIGSGGDVIIGSDPGGTELLRVGGRIRVNDGSTNSAPVAQIIVSSSAPSGDYPEGTIWARF